MLISGNPYRTIWTSEDRKSAQIIDQTRLPFSIEIVKLDTLSKAALAIETMQVRGAPCIGATAAYGMFLGIQEDPSDIGLRRAYARLMKTRPTAVNLRWAVDKMINSINLLAIENRCHAALEMAEMICNEDVDISKNIGQYGLSIIEEIANRKNGPVNILTHCNAGWLATVDLGTATAPIYTAHDKGIDLHIWVDETRPRNQGASLTAFELGAHGVPHTVIVDNVGGHLMQNGEVDICITGTDRTTRCGDVANKIGTYLKALAAYDNQVPFYVALPSTTIDWEISDGIKEIPIEERSGDEVRFMKGRLSNGLVDTVDLIPPESPVANYAFDVTPSRLITGFITERGLCEASEEGLLSLFPEKSA